MPLPHPATLKFNIRSDLFRQLGALEEAGVPADRALSFTRLPREVQPRLNDMSRYMRQGSPIAEAGLRSALFTPLESALLHAACSAGSPARTYRRLADYYAKRAARLAKIKSRMMQPLATLVIGVFLGPLPKLAAGSISAGGYLLRCLLPLFGLAGLLYLYTELPRRLKADSPALQKIPLDDLLTRIPWFGPMLVRRNVRDFLDSLALLLEAGMPILDALPIAVETIRNQALRRQFAQIRSRIEGGASFAQAIGELSFAGRAEAHALIEAGEASGSLPEILFRYSDIETESIGLFDDKVSEWLPRLVYTLVAAWVGYGIVQSGAFMPHLPEDLR